VDVFLSQLTLNLATPITSGQSVTFKYNDPTGANDTYAVQDVSGNDAVSLTTPQVVLNRVRDLTPPTISSAVLGTDGQTLTITFSEVIENMSWIPGNNNSFGYSFGNFFNFTVDSVSRGTSNLASSAGDTNQIVVSLAGLPVGRSSIVKLIYTDPNPTSYDAYSVHDLGLNELASVTKTVTNNSVL
jgi:hypothetical protein